VYQRNDAAELKANDEDAAVKHLTVKVTLRRVVQTQQDQVQRDHVIYHRQIAREKP
jgi:hypothetical protein